MALAASNYLCTGPCTTVCLYAPARKALLKGAACGRYPSSKASAQRPQLHGILHMGYDIIAHGVRQVINKDLPA